MHSLRNASHEVDDARPWAEALESTSATKHPALSRSSRRGKYVQRACDLCQKRKVKCEGGQPCSRCRANQKDCVFGQRRDEHSSSGGPKHSRKSSEAGYTEGMQQREMDWERDDSSWQTRTKRHQTQKSSTSVPTQPEVTENAASDSSPSLLEGDHTQTMVGEMSAFHTFDSDGVESDDEGDATSIMTTNEAPKNDLAASKLSDGWLPSIMKTHKVKADRRNFDISISLFFELAHTYHPLVHPPWVRQTHEELWQESFHRSDSGFARNVAKRLSVGMIFLCLAVGACQEPSRMNPEAECRTTGYSLYAVAMELLQPFLDLTQDQPPTMQSLQALGLNALYLIRIDAIGKAERILGLAVSGAHILGLQRHSTFERISLYDDQMRRRLLWCLYGLDRRISIETGRPLRIEDRNISTLKPLNLSDRFMERARVSGKRSAELTTETQTEVASSPRTSIPFLHGAISYGRIIGTFWNSLYGAKHASGRNQQDNRLSEVLDVLIEQGERQLAAPLSYDRSIPFDEQFKNQAPWQVKLTILTHMRYDFLRLIIRRSFYINSGPAAEKEQDTIGQAECVRIATEIVEDYLRIPSRFSRHTFPLLHHLTSAVMILFSIVMRTPAFTEVCRGPILAGVEALVTDCSKTWISGKLSRTISRLQEMVRSGFLETTKGSVPSSKPLEPFEQAVSQVGSLAGDTAGTPGPRGWPNLGSSHLSSRKPDEMIPTYHQTTSGTLAPGILSSDGSAAQPLLWPLMPPSLGMGDSQFLLDQELQQPRDLVTQPLKDPPRWAPNGYGVDTTEYLIRNGDNSWMAGYFDQDGAWWNPDVVGQSTLGFPSW